MEIHIFGTMEHGKSERYLNINDMGILIHKHIYQYHLEPITKTHTVWVWIAINPASAFSKRVFSLFFFFLLHSLTLRDNIYCS